MTGRLNAADRPVTVRGEPLNILMIGLGEHAQHVYAPVVGELARDGQARLTAVVDLQANEGNVRGALEALGLQVDDLVLVATDEGRSGALSAPTRTALNQLVDARDVEAVIISTEPLCHFAYAHWALERGLSVLMDKPVTTRRHVAHDLRQALGLMDDFQVLLRAHQQARVQRPQAAFSIMTQRRQHPAFLEMRRLIREVHARTGCPVTSVTAELADGEWRMPGEILHQDYHPYKEGYGAFSHSGYHALDATLWLMSAGADELTAPDHVDVLATLSFPGDHVRQLAPETLQRAFPSDALTLLPAEEMQDRTSTYGEIDGFASFAFRTGRHLVTHANVNIVHTSCSQRGWSSSAGRNLYQGNGRVRHETYFVHQGPFQTLRLLSYQARKTPGAQDESSTRLGAPNHLELHVFRNSNLFGDWAPVTTWTLDDHPQTSAAALQSSHQWQAKRNSVLEFVQALRCAETADRLRQRLTEHHNGVALLSAIYQSSARRQAGETPLVTAFLSPAPHR